MSDILLRMRDVSKSFQGVKALDHAQLTVQRGEIHALMGENGAGKSTLIKVLTGVHSPDQGTIEFSGRIIVPRSSRDAEQEGISPVFQEVNLIPTLSLADNILLGRQPTRLGCLRWGAIRQRARAAMQRLGLDIDVDTMLGTCSMAVQQMVAIARALDINAQLLILDEPTSSLDEREVQFLFEIMRRLREQGMAILFVTHFLEQVYAVSDRITVLRNGGFVGCYATPELPRLSLIAAMLGRSESESAKATAATPPSPSPTPAAPAPAAAPDVLLRAQGLGRRGWMNPISFEVRSGEVLGLAGLLGSGRTETAKMLFGIRVPDQGGLSWRGRPTRISSPREAVRLGMAFCSEDRKGEGVIPHLSVRENLVLALQASRGPLRLLSAREQGELAQHYVSALNIKAASLETPVQHLSGGNQQKVLLARWLAMQPKLIILDEPTRGIDVGAKAEIEKLIQKLRDQGMSVIFISSELEEVVRTCERVLVLRDRHAIGELKRTELDVDTVMRLIAHHESHSPPQTGPPSAPS